MRNFFPLFLGVTLALARGAFAGDLRIEALPRGRPFRLTFADPREIRMALAAQGTSRFDAVVGNYFSLLALEPERGHAWTVHFGIEGAGYFSLLHSNARFPLQSADGLVGTYLEGAAGNFQFQMRYTHISSHLADGSRGDTAFPYSREIWIQRVAYDYGYGRVYGGVHVLTHSIPQMPALSYQAGGSFFLPLKRVELKPFAAADLQWGPAMAYSPTLNLQLGVAFNDSPDAYRSVRLYYSYFTGTDPRGQFYGRPYTAHLVGIELQV